MACLFCLIIAGDEPSAIVLDEPEVFAFLDTRPVFKGHVLVVPRRHIVTLPELPGELITPLFETSQRVCDAVTSALDAQGTFVAMNNVVSQSVAHLHVHVVPRTKGDGLRGFFWPRTRYEDGEADVVAAQLREALRRAG